MKYHHIQHSLFILMTIVVFNGWCAPVSAQVDPVVIDLRDRLVDKSGEEYVEARDEALELPQEAEGQSPFMEAAIFITRVPARFQRLEADAFGSFTPLAMLGRLHPVGPKLFINLHHPGRRQLPAFEHAFVREVVRSNLHRHISPKRLTPC